MRSPTEIKDLDEDQVQAYYKSFLDALDGSDANLTDWETSFLGSCLQRSGFTDGQQAIIENLMYKFPKLYPQFDHYKTGEAARAYLGLV